MESLEPLADNYSLIEIDSQNFTGESHGEFSASGGGEVSPPLPPELWIEIFKCTLSNPKSDRLMLLKLSQVCLEWRAVAFSFHTLWTNRRFCIAAVPKSQNYLAVNASLYSSWLRLRKRHLTIDFRGLLKWNTKISLCVDITRIERIWVASLDPEDIKRLLELSGQFNPSPEELQSDLAPIRVPIRYLTPVFAMLPTLQEIKWSGRFMLFFDSFQWPSITRLDLNVTFTTVDTALGLFTSCPNLEYVRFYFQPGVAVEKPAFPSVVAPHLHTLHITGIRVSNKALIERLTLPALQVLKESIRTDEPEVLHRLMERSGCTLRELLVDRRTAHYDFHAYLSLPWFHSLERITLLECYNVDPIIRILTRTSSSHTLPYPRLAFISFVCCGRSDKLLALMVKSRWDGIHPSQRVLRRVILLDRSPLPGSRWMNVGTYLSNDSADDLAYVSRVWGELRNEGLDIQIGLSWDSHLFPDLLGSEI
ncbi:hypothetical protein C0991_005373 [Blastosporella zonata]|nr:hypothetical protein C0991_005373 [Blastosporella zonata]